MSDFDFLIPGQGWLIRNGKNYIEENMSEKGDNEDFSIPKNSLIIHTVKTTDLAPRTVIGHDKNGNLLLLQIDGQIKKNGINPFPDSTFNHGFGMTIFEVTDFALELGFYNAINLNTEIVFSVNKTIISQPSEICEINQNDFNDYNNDDQNNNFDDNFTKIPGNNHFRCSNFNPSDLVACVHVRSDRVFLSPTQTPTSTPSTSPTSLPSSLPLSPPSLQPTVIPSFYRPPVRMPTNPPKNGKNRNNNDDYYNNDDNNNDNYNDNTISNNNDDKNNNNNNNTNHNSKTNENNNGTFLGLNFSSLDSSLQFYKLSSFVLLFLLFFSVGLNISSFYKLRKQRGNGNYNFNNINQGMPFFSLFRFSFFFHFLSFISF